ncbi:MAG TPA: polysaccharide deacetylase family protein [Bryobacteraceae bacterium]|jgi:peptidoglycan/xylan/chitin deacetylase (PgdA/CDA1 family)
MFWKKAARVALHKMGGLAVLRNRHRREFGVLMFHSFGEQDETNLQAMCSHIVRHFEPVSLSDIVEAIDGTKRLPDNAIAITVDDGYKSFLDYGHPVFRRNKIPATVYAVGGFSDGRLWLWPDQIEFGLWHTSLSSIRIPTLAMELELRTPAEKNEAISVLKETLKRTPNAERLIFMEQFGRLCKVEIPPNPPAGRQAMTWDELRAVAAEGTEVGCHTQNHPILSRVPDPVELDAEIRGAKQFMEERLGFPVRHFCYPNGRPIDIGDAAIRCVREAGFASAVTCTYGFNSVGSTDPFEIRRIPFLSSYDLDYSKESLAGIHLPAQVT